MFGFQCCSNSGARDQPSFWLILSRCGGAYLTSAEIKLEPMVHHRNRMLNVLKFAHTQLSPYMCWRFHNVHIHWLWTKGYGVTSRAKAIQFVHCLTNMQWQLCKCLWHTSNLVTSQRQCKTAHDVWRAMKKIARINAPTAFDNSQRCQLDLRQEQQIELIRNLM